MLAIDGRRIAHLMGVIVLLFSFLLTTKLCSAAIPRRLSSQSAHHDNYHDLSQRGALRALPIRPQVWQEWMRLWLPSILFPRQSCSILDRSPPELIDEIILVDDCSDDGEGKGLQGPMLNKQFFYFFFFLVM